MRTACFSGHLSCKHALCHAHPFAMHSPICPHLDRILDTHLWKHYLPLLLNISVQGKVNRIASVYVCPISTLKHLFSNSSYNRSRPMKISCEWTLILIASSKEDHGVLEMWQPFFHYFNNSQTVFFPIRLTCFQGLKDSNMLRLISHPVFQCFYWHSRKMTLKEIHKYQINNLHTLHMVCRPLTCEICQKKCQQKLHLLVSSE